MEKLLSKLFRRGASGTKLLRGYVPYRAPFSGRLPTYLSDYEALANLDYLLQSREQRIAELQRLLRAGGADLAPALCENNLRDALTHLHRWITVTFPQIYDPRLANWEIWLKSSREGDEIVFSLLMDIGIVLGEFIVKNNPTFQWGVDLELENAEMMSYKRPTVLIRKGRGIPAPIIVDVEALVVEQYRKVPQRVFGTANELLAPISQAISGAYERHWTT